MEKVPSYYVMETLTRDNGKTTRCMVMGYTLGSNKEEIMKEISLMALNMVQVS